MIPVRPLSLRLSVTDRCALRCTYCLPAAEAPETARGSLLSFEELARFVSAIQRYYPVAQVRLTGGEPLLRPRIEMLVAMLAAAGVPDLALTTCGQQLAGRARTLKQAGLGRINISLDSLQPSTYAQITRGGVLEKTLAGIAAARDAGLHPIRLNAVVLRGQNDHEIAGLVRFAIGHGCQVRFLELMPIGEAAAGFEQRVVLSREVRERLAAEFSLTPLPSDPSGTSRNFLALDGEGRSTTVGLISPFSEPFCAGCWRLRLTASGVLIGCLALPEGIPVAAALRNRSAPDVEALRAAVDHALGMKRRNAEFAQPRQMVEIGG